MIQNDVFYIPQLKKVFHYETRNVSETYMPPLVQNLKLLLICTRHGCNPCIKFGID